MTQTGSRTLYGVLAVRVAASTALLFGCETENVLGRESDAGAETDGGDSGAPKTPAHERLDCDLPRVIEFCGGSTCHYDNAAADVASALVLWNRQENRMIEDIEARLVGVPASYRNVPDLENCPLEHELLVDPSDIEKSLILKKLEARQPCGVEMPKFPYPEWGTVALPGPDREAFVACIRSWVALLVEDYNQTQ